MAEKDASHVGTSVSDDRGQLALGVIATESNGDALARTVLRANDRDFEVFVTHYGDPTVEGVAFAERLGAHVVEPSEPRPDAEQLRRELAATARAHSCDGIVFQGDACERIDYARTLASFEEGVFGVDAIAEDDVGLVAGTTVVVGIPAYNESDSIGDVVRRAREHADQVLVVDDGSDDDTAAVAREAGAVVLEHSRNRGYGAALQTLFEEAARKRVDHLVVVDGDGQHDPADVPRLVDRQRESGAELVIGSRFADGGTTDAPLWRRFGLSVINLFTNLSLGIVRPSSRIRDTQSGFRVYDRTALQSLASSDAVGDRMSASVDILYHAHANGFQIEEVGTSITYDGDATSTHNPVAHGLTILHNIVKTVESKRPVTVLGIPGVVMLLVGIGFAYWTVLNYLNSGSFPYGLAITSTFFALAGIFSSFTAIILHSLNRRLE